MVNKQTSILFKINFENSNKPPPANMTSLEEITTVQLLLDEIGICF